MGIQYKIEVGEENFNGAKDLIGKIIDGAPLFRRGCERKEFVQGSNTIILHYGGDGGDSIHNLLPYNLSSALQKKFGPSSYRVIAINTETGETSTHLSAPNDAVNDEALEILEDNEQLQQAISQAEVQVKGLQREKESLQHRVDKLENNEYGRVIRSQQGTIKNLNERIAEVNEEAGMYRQQLQDQQSVISDAEKEARELRKRKSELEIQLANTSKTGQQLVAEKDRADKAERGMETQRKDYEGRIADEIGERRKAEEVAREATNTLDFIRGNPIIGAITEYMKTQSETVNILYGIAGELFEREDSGFDIDWSLRMAGSNFVDYLKDCAEFPEEVLHAINTEQDVENLASAAEKIWPENLKILGAEAAKAQKKLRHIEIYEASAASGRDVSASLGGMDPDQAKDLCDLYKTRETELASAIKKFEDEKDNLQKIAGQISGLRKDYDENKAVLESIRSSIPKCAKITCFLSLEEKSPLIEGETEQDAYICRIIIPVDTDGRKTKFRKDMDELTLVAFRYALGSEKAESVLSESIVSEYSASDLVVDSENVQKSPVDQTEALTSATSESTIRTNVDFSGLPSVENKMLVRTLQLKKSDFSWKEAQGVLMSAEEKIKELKNQIDVLKFGADIGVLTFTYSEA